MRFNGRLGTGVLATSLMAAGMFAVCAVAVPGTASARCAGEGNRITSEYYYGGVRRAAETPISGTCNGNSDYQAVLQDTYSDGRFVSVQFRDAGYDWRRIADATSSEEYRCRHAAVRGGHRLRLGHRPGWLRPQPRVLIPRT